MPQVKSRTLPSDKELRRHLKHLASSFEFFYIEVCRKLGLDPPSRTRLDVAHWMQYGPKRRGVLAARNTGKTFLASVYDVWRLFRNGLEMILHCSKTMDFSKDSLSLERKWINSVPFLRQLTPKKSKFYRDSKVQFDVGTANPDLIHSASVNAGGIIGQLTGGRATIIIPDDVETGENTRTKGARDELLKRIEEFEFIILPDGDIIYIGTPHHEESIYRLLRDRGYVFRAWPLVYPAPGEEIPDLAPMLRKDLESGRAKPGDPVWPTIFPEEEIRLKRLATSTAGFAMQYQLRTDLLETETYPLHLCDFIVFDIHRDKAPETIAWGRQTGRGSTAREDIAAVGFTGDNFYAPIMVDEKWLPYHGCKAFIDPAGSGADEMAWAIVGQLHGYLYVKYVDGVKGGATSENLEQIVLSLREHDARDVLIEAQFGGDMLVHLLDPIIRKYMVRPGENEKYPNGWACVAIAEPARGQKEIRILENLEPPLQQHRIVLAPSVANDEVLCHQITRLTRQRNCLEHEDRVEALSGAIAQFKTYLDQDAGEMAKLREAERKKKRMDKYRHHFAGSAEPRRWGGWRY